MDKMRIKIIITIILVFAVFGILGCFLFYRFRSGDNITADDKQGGREDELSTVDEPLTEEEWTTEGGTDADGGHNADSGPDAYGGHSTDGVPLLEFCSDTELSKWFDSLKEEPPVSLDYSVYSIAPYTLEFTDQEMILETAEALLTVRIGEVTDFDPDSVSDGAGESFRFIMEDGSEQWFAFDMNTFSWNGGERHVIADYGRLHDITAKLHDEGYHEYAYIYADNDAFYTRYYDLYETAWESEEELFGGIGIYMDGTGKPPFITIRRILGEDGDPERYLTGTLKELAEKELKAEGYTVEKVSGVEYVERKDAATSEVISVPRLTIDQKTPDGGRSRLKLLVTVFTDTMMHKDVLMQFAARYDPDDEEEENKVMRALDTAMNELYLKKYRDYEEGGVRTGEPLFIFCNDERLNEWYEKALADPPELVFSGKTWYDGYDSETVIKVLKALKTVRIGEESTKNVGGSGRRIYDFVDRESGNPQSFMFFEDTFDWNGKSYDVLDWGELDDINMKKLGNKNGG